MKELSLHILDIVQNSIRAKASQILITIDENKFSNQYILTIEDNGMGMSSDVLTNVVGAGFKPAPTTPTNRGQGLPLLKQNVEKANGNLQIFSEKHIGTKLVATFQFDHINRLPIGDISGVVVMLAQMNPSLDFVYKHITSKGEYRFDTKEIKEILDDLSIQNISIYKYLKELIEENLNGISYDNGRRY